MSIPQNEIKRITNLYNSVVQYYFSQNPREILDIEDKPFYNLAECLFNLMKSEPFFSEELLWDSINYELERFESLPNITEIETHYLINNIYSTFEINKQKHYILIPLQGSQLNSDCSFGKFNFVSIKIEIENRYFKEYPK